MCGSPKTPKVQTYDAQAEAAKAADAAAAKLNAEAAARRRGRRRTSMLATGARGADETMGASVLASAAPGGKAQLGA